MNVVADVQNIRRGIDDVNTQLSGFSTAASKVGDTLKGALAGGIALAAGGGVATFFKDAVTGASDLNETVAKTQQILGTDGANAVMQFAETAATSLGQSKQQALDASATFATFGKAAGLAGTDLAAFATQNTQLATDLASFNNTTPEQAIEALGAAFRGEAEPMRQYGVLLDDATLRQEAMALGLIRTTKEALTPQQKVLAAQSAILKQTSDAQGDFERTSGGLANQQRILAAEWENTKTALGQGLLPALTGFVSFLNSSGLPAIKSFGSFLADNKTPILAFGAAVGALTLIMAAHSAVMAVQAAGGMLAWLRATTLARTAVAAYTAVQWLLNAAMAANPIGLVVVAIAALVAAFVLAYRNSETFRNIVNGVWNWLKSATSATFNAVKNFIVSAWTSIVSVTMSVFNSIKSFIASAIVNVLTTVARVIEIKNRFQDAFQQANAIIVSKIAQIIGVVREIPGRIVSAMGDLGGRLRSAGGQLIQGFIGGIQDKVGAAVSAVKNAVGNVVSGAKSALGIRSPSRVFKTIGKYTVQGLEQGLNQVGGLRKAAANMANVVSGGFEPKLSLSGAGFDGSGSMRGGNTYNLSFEGVVAGDPMEYARFTRGALEEFERANGR
ncbi:hypothetical protein FHN55_17045 [Streptomyces sp. NP160]|uniref:phage tail protein n=1 Tax=Streptomyces sp. NP160 TaxID=2586637 RepID=UPI0011195DC9|nr:hypothetical protein [Streptomyces sp. NP160]TNM61535.1 hypothetical protein FHN55_17045 [Streptomyces sp. NP160]